MLRDVQAKLYEQHRSGALIKINGIIVKRIHKCASGYCKAVLPIPNSRAGKKQLPLDTVHEDDVTVYFQKYDWMA